MPSVIPTSTPVATENVNFEGTTDSLARADHVHQTKVDAQNVQASDSVSNVSTTDVLLEGMSLTPGEGNWLLMFSCQQKSTNSQSIAFSVYVNDIKLLATERSFRLQVSNISYFMSLQTLLTDIQDNQTIDIRWHVSNDEATVDNRELILIRAV